MLFNSFEFIFFFVPATVLGFFLLSFFKNRVLLVSWLSISSIFFYGWWNAALVPLLAGSICVNYVLGRFVARGGDAPAAAKAARIGGIAGNLALLGWFKYAGFLAVSWNTAAGAGLTVPDVVLPLAISFFTFQQIAYLCHAADETHRDLTFTDYALFVSFFPQLIAGPIVLYDEVGPQYRAPGFGTLRARNLAAGFSIFAIGLFKKVVLADYSAVYSDAAFAGAAKGIALTPVEAWVGAVCYAFQIYFDFSGYSDMAIGLAFLFAIRLPLNFDSPYKARSIIEFWRRWHMTLSRFLRDYLYVPLGGNRHGEPRRFANLLIVMVLGGLWHGAGWTFVVWGGLHGLYLAANHLWRMTVPRAVRDRMAASRIAGGASWLLTLLAVTVAWVVFRAGDFAVAADMWRAMFGLAGANGLPMFANDIFYHQDPIGPWLVCLLAIVLFAPNSQEIMGADSPGLDPWRGRGAHGPRGAGILAWRTGIAWGGALGAAWAVSVMRLGAPSPFLYFQF